MNFLKKALKKTTKGVKKAAGFVKRNAATGLNVVVPITALDRIGIGPLAGLKKQAPQLAALVGPLAAKIGYGGAAPATAEVAPPEVPPLAVEAGASDVKGPAFAIAVGIGIVLLLLFAWRRK